MTLLTVREVAERLRLGKSTVYLLIQRKELPAVRFGSSVRVPEALFEEWLSTRVEGADGFPGSIPGTSPSGSR